MVSFLTVLEYPYGGFIMERAKCAVSTVCYLMKDDETLFIQFNKKWGHVFAPPGGKMIDGESPLECIILYKRKLF